MQSLPTVTVPASLSPWPAFLLILDGHLWAALLPVVRGRLEGALDHSSLAGSDTAQEGLQVAGSEVSLGGRKR